MDAAADRNGNLLIVYNKGDYFAEDVYAVSVSRAGSVTRAPWRMNSYTNSMQKYPTVALNADGNGVVAWTDFAQQKIMARQVSNDGLSNDAEFTVFTSSGNVRGDATSASAANSSGDFLISWGANNGGASDLYARRYGSSGQPKTDAFIVNTFRGGEQANPFVVLNDLGWSAFAWSSSTQDAGTNPGLGTYAQLFDPQGNPAGGEFRVATTVDYDQFPVGLVMDADADLTFAWNHGGWNYPNNDIVAFRQYRVNLAPVFGSPPTFTLAENSSTGTVVGTYQATDPDGDGLTYSLVGTTPFAIDAQTGRITVADPTALDFEQSRSFVFSVRATDHGNPGQSTQGTVTLNLTDVNEAPDLRGETLPAAENSADGWVVAQMQATDPDAGAHLIYSLDDNAGGRFAIHPTTGVITVIDPSRFDYEGSGPNHSYQVTVRVSDGQLSTSEAYSIGVTNVAPFVPVNVSGTAALVAEGAATGTAVGIVASAADPAGGTITYSLTDSAGGRFAINPTTGAVMVAAGSLIDYEGSGPRHSYFITIQASDGLLTISSTFEIAVANVPPQVASVAVPKRMSRGAS